MWWCWVRRDGRIDTKAFQVLLGTVLGVFIGRLIQDFSSYRPRPIHNPDLYLTIPNVLNTEYLREWSSFPSDHAILVFSLSTAIWSFNRKLGVFCFLWSTFLVGFPRIYLGIHYFSDVLAGAALGFLIMAFVLTVATPPEVNIIFENVQKQHPKLVYAAMFLITFEVATIFEGTRSLLSGVSWIGG